jgi:hypothetical protein
MPTNYLPREEAKLVTWTGEFVTTLTPLVAKTDFPIDSARLAQYVTTRDEFVTAYNTANNPTTRTKPAVTEKNARKATLIRSTRSVVDVLQAWPDMTNTLRDELGISQRGKKPEPSPIPAKAFVKVLSIDGRDVTLEIRQGVGKAGRPRGAQGATVMIAYGAEAPAETTAWTLATNTGRTKTTITLDAVPAACTAWISAFFWNGRKQSGPASTPVSVSLAAMVAAPVPLKIKKAA